ncbi:acetyl-CoA acetyltransferase [Sphingobium quisquiliarum P25]|uniref:Acetyl-CoA acetyltransferase n=1 Tax=Sphingobium quisquiliarum P25 TaxID=1329909 RepID=T0HW69_9SPHN|nr:acetyl-CoA C-acyltransferase [Sphingobium quisquiliarum]EQB01784.1 acetyl-CoA acetyltransferase [Sphingobium quisquiliarum P25]
MQDDPVVIAGYARTPMGGFQGALSALKATELGTVAVKAAVERAGVQPDAVDRIYMGCVLPAGLGQAPARQAALGAGLPRSVEATTVNKMCGSGMQAAIMAAEAIAAGGAGIIVAGGMESMTNAPYALPKHRSGARIGHDRVIDTMMMDGLEDAYEPGKAMGVFAEQAVRDYQFTREEQDDYAIRSLNRARAAIEAGAFVREIAPVTVPGRNGGTIVDTDEQPGKAKPDKIPGLKPAFVKDGTITAANASSISDGAAALVLTRKSVAESHGLPIVATVAATAAHAHEPALFTTAPVPAIRKVLDKAGWSVDDVDLFEVNEAFAVVAMIAARDLGIPADKLNVNGGATALGHPIGASGARIVATLIAALQNRGLKRGVASLCIGGGEATAMAIELN